MSGKKIIIITLITMLVLAAGIYSMYEYYNVKLDHMREAGVTALRSSVDLSGYSKYNQKKIEGILDEGEEQIRNSKQQYEIDQVLTQTESEIDGIKTIKQNRREARKKLNNLVSLKKYREEQRKEVKKILKKYRKKINKKTTRKQMNRQVTQAKKEINKIKTDAQLTAEEEAARQAELERQRLAAEAAEKARKEKEAREAKKKKNSSSGKNSRKNNSGGCVGDDAKNYY